MRGPLRASSPHPFRRIAAPVAAACLTFASVSHAGRIRVPADHPGIQAAINAAQSGDTVLVARGTYPGGLVISGKTITLASSYILTNSFNDIHLTVIEGGDPILRLESSVGAGTTIRGLTFRNGGYHVVNYADHVNILNNRFVGGGDQVSFESAGGLVSGCFFTGAADDGIDVDDASHPTIVNNVIQNAGNDGIEMRLHPYTGPTLQVVIRGNRITGCTEDGIQLIDYPGASNRSIRIEGNVLANNRMAGLGCMADGATTENLAGAPLVEPVVVIGNTFSGNPHGLTGGDNMLVVNNIFVGSTVGVKRVAGTSLVTHNDFWSNGTHHTGSNVDAATTLFQDPGLNWYHQLQSGSPCIDAGAAAVSWNGVTVTPASYAGPSPDLGAYETLPFVSVPGAAGGTGLALLSVHPNPSHRGFRVAFRLEGGAGARLEVLDVAGRRVLARDLNGMVRGGHVVELHEAGALPAGAYLVRLVQGERSLTARARIVR